MLHTFDDLPEGDVRSHQKQIRKQTGYRWIICDPKANYDITGDHPAQGWAEKKGKAVRISKLSKASNNWSYLVFEGYCERYVIVEFDVYLPDEKVPFTVGLTYFSTFNWANRGPKIWSFYKPRQSGSFELLPHGQGKDNKINWAVNAGRWMRYRVVTDMEQKTVSLYSGSSQEEMQLLLKDITFKMHDPIFCNAIYLRLDSGCSRKYVYIDNIKICETTEKGKNGF